MRVRIRVFSDVSPLTSRFAVTPFLEREQESLMVGDVVVAAVDAASVLTAQRLPPSVV